MVPNCHGQLWVSTTFGRSYPLQQRSTKRRPWATVGQLGRWDMAGGNRQKFTIQFDKVTRAAVSRRRIGATVRLHANDNAGHRALGKRKVVLRPVR